VVKSTLIQQQLQVILNIRAQRIEQRIEPYYSRCIRIHGYITPHAGNLPLGNTSRLETGFEGVYII